MHNSSGKHRFGYSTRNQFSKQSSRSSQGKASTGRSPGRGRLAGDDVIDAEFEDIEGGVRRMPPEPFSGRVEIDPVDVRASDFDDIVTGSTDRLDLFSGRKPPEKQGFRLSTTGYSAIIVVLCLTAFWFSGGYALAPGLLGNLSGEGLTLSRVSIDPLRVRDSSYFVVHGVIKNDSSDDQDVPLLAIGPGAAPEGTVPLYARAGKNRLAAGESTRFRVRVPNQIRDYDQLTVTLAGGGTAR
ncbi:MAG: hypothetical protein GY789_22510 [Hyphomicrobiales bacterium]|nr:hypothetical protein [Hyphomicrobiales bacterium]MCP4998340.1 hypothetical protein [Hyphomicrobiales bacterium]